MKSQPLLLAVIGTCTTCIVYAIAPTAVIPLLITFLVIELWTCALED
jgi:hypothetical protein